MIFYRLLNNSKFIYFLSLATASLYNILLLPIITSELKPKEYSDYIIIFQIIGFIQGITALSYLGGIMKFWNDFSVQKKKEYLNSIFSLLILLTLSIILSSFLDIL